MMTYEWAPADNERDFGYWSAQVAGGKLLATETSYGMQLGHSTIGVLGHVKLREVTWVIDVEIRLPAANLADAKFRAQRRYERLLIAEQVAVDEGSECYDLTQEEPLAQHEWNLPLSASEAAAMFEAIDDRRGATPGRAQGSTK
jgi:hypothetical protein